MRMKAGDLGGGLHEGKRPMQQQEEEGPERKRVQVSVKDALAQWGQRSEVQGERETRTAGDQGRCRGENKRPRENAPEGSRRSLPMDLSLIQQLQSRERGRG